MDLKGLVNKARDTLRKNPNLIEKGGDAIDKATGNKYAGQVDKAQDAVRKAVGAQNKAPENKAPENKAPGNEPGAPQQ
ncbi:antitoxin [Gordonia westfalica]|uniref:Antitoxin n=1 Tax=Gordonia westfalica TaxID=158898 RepID=A0A1H2JQ08_9ACTN|nr:antitoxin [Gordonia westfalica]MDS1115875.1 antitoxin [Gordonia westfalica]SDU58236.1 MT0933-like antitoxin protein [Gordonia westfalica]